MKGAYYNEIDPYVAAWLRNLIAAGHIAHGDVDERSIEDVKPDDLKGYAQCHFFAGIGVWSYALRLAGWPDDRAVWSGSCPCQPFSAAGKRGGTSDERHLWPAWSWLIRQCKPGVVFGEQVASKDGRNWLDLVQTDLEGMGFAVGAGDICAAGVGAPHIRQRLYFVADSELSGPARLGEHGGASANGSKVLQAVAGSGGTGELADASRKQRHGRGDSGSGGRGEPANGGVMGHSDDEGSQGRGLRGATGGGNGASERAAREAGALDWLMADNEAGRRSEVDTLAGGSDEGDGPQGRERLVGGDGTADRLEQSCGIGRQRRETTASRHDDDRQAPERQESEYGPRIASPYRGEASHFWSACDWLPCIDGKARPVEPGTFPLVNGATARVGRLRAYGNAIVAPCAEAFIRAYLETGPATGLPVKDFL